MRHAAASMLLAVMLYICFSLAPPPVQAEPTGDDAGYLTNGQIGPVVPGGGSEPVVQMPMIPEPVSTESRGEVPEQTAPVESNREEVTRMPEISTLMVLAFWRGVAAVLIGESCALLIAWAALKCSRKRE